MTAVIIPQGLSRSMGQKLKGHWRSHVHTWRDTTQGSPADPPQANSRQNPNLTTGMICTRLGHSQSLFLSLKTKIVHIEEITKNGNSCNSESWEELGLCIYQRLCICICSKIKTYELDVYLYAHIMNVFPFLALGPPCCLFRWRKVQWHQTL